MKKVGIIMGSDSDLPVAEKALGVLKEYGVPYEMHVFSAHRTPVEARDFALNARERGYGVIIAAAGKAAHLAGAIAASTTLPVIGLPIKSSTLSGMDALLSTVQMPSGIPVATVAIDGAENAALLSVQILAVSDSNLAEKLDAARVKMREKVLALLRETCPGIDFENEKALVDDEILASLDIITIVSELMYRFSIELDVDDIMPENFNDLDSITELVESRLGE